MGKRGAVALALRQWGRGLRHFEFGNRLLPVILFISIPSATFADAPRQASDLQEMLDSNDFHGAVLGATQLLDLSGPAGGLVDRGLVLSIKAEGYLQLKYYQLAADTFSSAAKEETDPARSAADKAAEILVRRSSSGVYMPRVGEEGGLKPRPMDILVRSSRSAVYPILFKDEWTNEQSEFMQGNSTHDMTLLLGTLEKAYTLRQLEIAATGKDNQTRTPLTTLSQHAYELMTGTLSQENKRVTDDKAEAEKKVHTQKLELTNGSSRRSDYSSNVQHVRTAGLSARLTNDLQGIILDCSNIAPAADSIGRLSDVRVKWSPIVAEAQRISGRAQDVLDADYDTADKHGETLLGR